jgi:hypothetical protein
MKRILAFQASKVYDYLNMDIKFRPCDRPDLEKVKTPS